MSGEVRTTEQKRAEMIESLDPLGKRDDRNADVTNGEVWWLLGELDAQATRDEVVLWICSEWEDQSPECARFSELIRAVLAGGTP